MFIGQPLKANSQEMKDALNLLYGVRLEMFHPRRAARSCKDCMKWRYGDDEKPQERPHGSGRRIEREPGEKPPCEACPKIPTGMAPTPSSACDLSDKNRKAYAHWQECEAVNWVDCAVDPIVKRNAAIIKQAHDEWKLKPLTELATLLPLMAATKR